MTILDLANSVLLARRNKKNMLKSKFKSLYNGAITILLYFTDHWILQKFLNLSNLETICRKYCCRNTKIMNTKTKFRCFINRFFSRVEKNIL